MPACNVIAHGHPCAESGRGRGIFTKCIIVVEDDVDVFKHSEVFFRLCANTGPQPDRLFTKGRSDVPDPATSEIASGSMMGIAATKKFPGEGFKRPWPPLINLAEAARKRIDSFNRSLEPVLAKLAGFCI